MSEITRVPLQPVAQGSVTKIWLGVAVAALIGIGGAYAARPQHFAAVYVEASSRVKADRRRRAMSRW
jgi:FKBP-type peptidyl-prolyl cis-trans isomerase FkpA